MSLSSCPFCGDANVVVMEVDIQRWSVLCSKCEATGPTVLTKAIAIQAWESVAGIHNRLQFTGLARRL
jgi:Lar family restriction alleviation protein